MYDQIYYGLNIFSNILWSLYIFVLVSELHLFSKLKEEKPDLVVLVLSILVVLVHHQFDERDSAGFCCLGEETSSRKTFEASSFA